MILTQSTQALKLSEGELPLVLSALETKPSSHIVDSMRDIAIEMFETHRHNPDASEVFQAQFQRENQSTIGTEDCSQNETEEWPDDTEGVIERYGEVAREAYLIKPKRPVKARGTHGSEVSAKKGAENHPRHFPNTAQSKGTEKGKRNNDMMEMWRPWPLLGRFPSSVQSGTVWKQRKGKRKDGHFCEMEINSFRRRPDICDTRNSGETLVRFARRRLRGEGAKCDTHFFPGTSSSFRRGNW